MPFRVSLRPCDLSIIHLKDCRSDISWASGIPQFHALAIGPFQADISLGKTSKIIR